MGSDLCNCLDVGDQDKQERNLSKSAQQIQVDERKTEHTVNKLSLKSQKAIATAHLLCKLVAGYFSSDQHKCDRQEFEADDGECKILINTILSSIVTIGGASRDYVLERDINDIDINIVTRELTKIQLNHLNKYHDPDKTDNKDTKCILYRHYLNKFTKDGQQYDAKFTSEQMTTIKYIRNCPYILNARFFADNVFMDKNILSNKVSFRRNEYSIFQFQIIDKIQYLNYDVNGVGFDMIDAHIRESEELEFTMNEDKDQKQHYHESNKKTLLEIGGDKYETKRLDLFVDKDGDGIDDREQKIKDIEHVDSIKIIEDPGNDYVLPILADQIQDIVEGHDFTINVLMIKWSSIYNIDKPETIDFNWDDKIVEYVQDYKVSDDIINKSLTAMDPDKTVLASPPHKYIWRIIKFGVRLQDWNIDKKLIEANKKYYHLWIDKQDYWQNKENVDDFCKRLKKNKKDLKTLENWKRYIELFDIIEINDRVIDGLKDNEYFKKTFWETVAKTANGKILKDVIEIFEDRGYPN